METNNNRNIFYKYRILIYTILSNDKLILLEIKDNYNYFRIFNFMNH